MVVAVTVPAIAAQGNFTYLSSVLNKLNAFARGASLRKLRALAAVARTGSVSAAAKELHVTPPAISLQLRQLEEEAGIPLFERTRNGLQLTEAGREVEAAAVRIEMVLRDCGRTLDMLGGAGGGTVAVAVISTAKYFAPRILAAFKQNHPGVDIRLIVGNRREIIAALRGFDADLAIMGRPPVDFDVEHAAIGDHPHVIIARADHPLARRNDLRLVDLANETFLLREPGSGTRMLAESTFAAAGITPQVGMEIGSNETIKQAVMAGLGIALLSAHTLAVELVDGRLVALAVDGTPITRQWHVVKRSERRLSPAERALWSFLAERARAFLPDVALRS